MSTDYNAISTNTDGLGQGPFGYGQGYQGSLYGGDPAQQGALNAGGAAGGTLNAGAPMHPGARMVGGQPGMATGPGGSASNKPPVGQLIGQLFGISPPTGMHPRGVQHPQPVRGPIAGFGPRPMPRHGRVGGGTGGTIQGGTGGSLNAGGAGGRMKNPIQRGPTPNPIRQRQGTI